jgi:Domain of unknown function (DUF4439)
VTGQNTVPALQAALAAEHTAVYAYGVIGAHLDNSRRTTALLVLDAHKAMRDKLRTYLTAAAATPVAAAPAYRLPVTVTSTHTATQLAATIETGLVSAYTSLAGCSDAALRRYAALAMQQAAVRSFGWHATVPAAFPGMPSAALTSKPAS